MSKDAEMADGEYGQTVQNGRVRESFWNLAKRRNLGNIAVNSRYGEI